MAKHYPKNGPPSQTNLNDYEDFSDCESLDSFFDEEFDDREHTEKLGDLLSCNTLGVESKVSDKNYFLSILSHLYASYLLRTSFK